MTTGDVREKPDEEVHEYSMRSKGGSDYGPSLYSQGSEQPNGGGQTKGKETKGGNTEGITRGDVTLIGVTAGPWKDHAGKVSFERSPWRHVS